MLHWLKSYRKLSSEIVFRFYEISMSYWESLCFYFSISSQFLHVVSSVLCYMYKIRLVIRLVWISAVCAEEMMIFPCDFEKVSLSKTCIFRSVSKSAYPKGLCPWYILQCLIIPSRLQKYWSDCTDVQANLNFRIFIKDAFLLSAAHFR